MTQALQKLTRHLAQVFLWFLIPDESFLLHCLHLSALSISFTKWCSTIAQLVFAPQATPTTAFLASLCTTVGTEIEAVVPWPRQP